MTQDRLPNQLSPSREGGDASPATWAVWVREQWGAVRVIALDTTQLADVPGRVRVRAVIHLGPLSPADVYVDALAGEAEPADTTRPRLGELWSAQSFRNGTFVFEGFAETEALGESRVVTVRVRPRRAQETLSDLRSVSRSWEVHLEPATRGARSDGVAGDVDRAESPGVNRER